MSGNAKDRRRARRALARSWWGIDRTPVYVAHDYGVPAMSEEELLAAFRHGVERVFDDAVAAGHVLPRSVVIRYP